MFQKGDMIRMVTGTCDCPACQKMKTEGGQFISVMGSDYEVLVTYGGRARSVSFPIHKDYSYELMNVTLENE